MPLYSVDQLMVILILILNISERNSTRVWIWNRPVVVVWYGFIHGCHQPVCILDCCCFGFFTLSNDFQQQFLVSFGSAKHLLCPPAQCSFGHQPAETRVVLHLCTAMGMDGPTCLPFISISVPLGIETPMQPVLDKLGQFGCKEPICQVGMVGDRLDPHAVGSTLRFLQEALEVWPVVVCFAHGEVEGWITFLVAQCQEFHTSLTPILPRALNLSGIHLHAIHQLFGRHVLHHRT